MIAKSERLTVLSDAEQEALYGLPDFDVAELGASGAEELGEARLGLGVVDAVHEEERLGARHGLEIGDRLPDLA